MAKPCAVFWDIQNIDVPKGQTVDSIVDLIRSTIIKPYNLNEISFFCVCDVHQLPSNFGQSLTALNVDIVQAYNGIKDSADIKMMDLMRKFVKFSGQDCTIILLSGDADYRGTLSDLKRLHNVSIHLIRLANSCSPELDKMADYTFMLANGELKLVKSNGSPKYFISILNQYTSASNFNGLMKDVNALAIGSIENSAILCGNLICIGFATLWDAKRAIEQLSAFRSIFLDVELLVDSPLTKILKCIKPNEDMQTKSNNEVKQLTCIKISNSSEADINKIIEFCIACTTESGSQCILSRKSYLWIVFAFKSDAQDCLSKVQITYPDAIISDPPVDLTLSCSKDPYFVESCEEIDKNEVPESNNASSADVRDGTDCKMFFRYNSNFIAPLPYYQPSKWSLLYNLFEKLYDLGAKKVICDGNLYCVHFDSVSAYQGAFQELSVRYLEPLESVDAPETFQQKVTMKMKRYSGIPWCLNEQLDLHCLVVKMKSQLHDHFIDIGKNILGNRECIFIKSTPEEIWIGFPDELICENSKKTVDGFIESLKLENNVSMAKPSKELLESINFQDLAGDAYDLAFLSSQLEDLKPIKRPHIIERIRVQRMQEQECNEAVFHFTAHGHFGNTWSELDFPYENIVKILVKFSKVIPLAATAAHDEVKLIYNSWHEAYAASIFIDKLRHDEVRYFDSFFGASLVEQQQLDCHKISDYYIIDDKRKVLEKIVQNKSLVDQSDLYSSTVQSTTDIDVSDEEMKMKLQHLFTITTNSGFKFTSGMISIIKMHLVSMDCPICIEFEDKIWVAVDDLEKGNKAKARIEQIKFKILDEYDDDFQVGVVMESIQKSPPKVTKMLANKLMNPKTSVNNVYLNCDVYPLGHFNYSYRKAVGMSISRYCQLNV